MGEKPRSSEPALEDVVGIFRQLGWLIIRMVTDPDFIRDPTAPKRKK